MQLLQSSAAHHTFPNRLVTFASISISIILSAILAIPYSRQSVRSFAISFSNFSKSKVCANSRKLLVINHQHSYNCNQYRSKSYKVSCFRSTMSTTTYGGDGGDDIINDKSDSNSIYDDSPRDETTMNVTHHAIRTIRLKKEEFIAADRCESCFLSRTFCVCSQIRRIYNINKFDSKLILCSENYKVHLCIYMHFKEWGRASNTGKLLLLGQPHRTSLHIFGIPEDELSLQEHLLEHPSLILYPSPRARPISEYNHLLNISNSELNREEDSHSDRKVEMSEKATDKILRLCVIDATWPQSRTMEKELPQSVPRVRIDEHVCGPSKFLSRKQSTNKSKVSTIEAVSMALAALGSETEETLARHQTSLEFAVDALLQQGGKSAVYGNKMQPQFMNSTKVFDALATAGADDASDQKETSRKRSLHFGPYTEPQITKPPCCLHCFRKLGDTNFKNLGLRKRKETEEGQSIDKSKLSPIDEIMYAGPYRVWKCGGCNEFFPSPSDH